MLFKDLPINRQIKRQHNNEDSPGQERKGVILVAVAIFQNSASIQAKILKIRIN
jgi:hypothetical protein